MASQDAARFVGHTFDLAPALEPAEHGLAYVNRQAIAREWAQFMLQRPLVLAPVSAQPPFEVDADLADVEAAGAVVDSMRMVGTVNCVGLPAAAVPVGEIGGLPQGVQAIGPRWREDLCLDAAQAIESVLGTLTPIDPR